MKRFPPFLYGLILALSFFRGAHAANTGPQLSTFVSDDVFHAAVSWRDADSNLLTRVEVSVDSFAWYSDSDVVPLVTTERNGDFNRWVYRINPDFFPDMTRVARLTTSRPRPLGTAGPVSLAEDSSAVIVLTASDPAGAPQTFSRIITGLPKHGRLYDGTTPSKQITTLNTVITDPEFRVLYVPDSHFGGSDNFSYKVKKGWTESSSRLVQLTITPVNNRPIAQPPAVVTDEDTRIIFPLGGFDPDGDQFISYVRGLPSQGRLYQLREDGATLGPQITGIPIGGVPVSNSSYLVAYIPRANYNGMPVGDTLLYDLTDGIGYSSVVTVLIGVRSVNDLPVVRPAIHQGEIHVPITGVMLDAIDIDTPLAGRILSFPARGKLYRKIVSPEYLLTPENNTFDSRDLKYLHEEPVTGGTVQYSFTYEIYDGEFTTPPITDVIEIRKTKERPLPTGSPTHVSTQIGEPIDIILNGVDPDGDSSNLRFQILASPQHGTLSFFDITGAENVIFDYPFDLDPSDPSIGWPVRYTPTEAGEDFFEFTLQDQDGLYYYNEAGGTTIRVNISVVHPNRAPVAIGPAVFTEEDTGVTFTLSGTDPDGDTLTSTIRLVAGHGKLYQVAADDSTIGPEITAAPTVITNPRGLVHYVPDNNYHGTDTTRFDVFDGTTFSTRVTVVITIAPVNDLPVANPRIHTGDLTAVVLGVILDIGDADSPLVGHITQFPARGRLYRKTVAPQNLITPGNNAFFDLDLQYAIDEPVNGGTVEYQFSFSLTDGAYTSPTITDTIRLERRKLRPVPTGSPSELKAAPGIPVDFALNGIDPDGDSSGLIFRIVTAPSHGTLFWFNFNDEWVPITQYPFILPSSDPSVGWNVRYVAGNVLPDFIEFSLQDQQGLFYQDDNGQELVRVNFVQNPETVPNDEPLPIGSPTTAATLFARPVEIALNGVDPDGDSSTLRFTILEPPDLGTLAVYDLSGELISINQYPFLIPPSTPELGWVVVYTPTSVGSDFIEFTLQDQHGIYYTAGTSQPQALAVDIEVFPNLEPVPNISPTFTQINTGRTAVFKLDGSDPDGDGALLNYTVLAPPPQGLLRYYTGTGFATIPSYPFTLPVSARTTDGWFLQYFPSSVVGLYSFEITVQDQDGIYYTGGAADGQPQPVEIQIQVDPRL